MVWTLQRLEVGELTLLEAIGLLNLCLLSLICTDLISK